MKENMKLKDALTELVAQYPNTDREDFLNLYPFDGIGQPAKSHMLHLFALYALGAPQEEVKGLKVKCIKSLANVVFMPPSKTKLSARFKALQLITEARSWTDMFKEIVETLEITESSTTAVLRMKREMRDKKHSAFSSYDAA